MNETFRSATAGELPCPGDVICGKYRIESVVGSGGMGVVMGGIDTSLNRPVAIKFLAPHKITHEGAVARFLREARAAAAIQSEHVVRVFEVGTLPNGAPFIVMEHLRGMDLAHLLQHRGALPVEEACDLLLQACEAIGEAHGRGIVHRDLKPQNLFVAHQPDGSVSVKVLDFGISKAADDGSTPHLTSTDTVRGTPLYMSPEQVRSLKNVDARADIWALGAILFELLTMSPIFQAPSASALCAMIAMDPPTPLRARRPQAPAELEAVILRCLHKDPAGRFPDVAAFAEALAPFASERGRLSATRVSKVVRGSQASQSPFTPAAPGATVGAYATTGTGTAAAMPLVTPAYPSAHPEMAHAANIGVTPPPPAFGPSQPPPPYGSHSPSSPYATQAPYPGAPGAGLQPPTTQSTWQQTGTGPSPQRKGSGVVVAIAGVLTGLVLLGLVGGSAWYFIIHKDTTPTATAATTTPDAAAPPPAATTVTTTPATPLTTAAKGPNPPKPSGAKDGGAPGPTPPTPPPPAQKDAGAPNKDEEREAALAKAAERNCQHQSTMMNMARDEAAQKKAADQAKLFTCNKGMQASRCERQVCLRACSFLHDQECIRQVNYYNDQWPPKY
jgi:eukaryotic-like serine/threonine-protein kinase